MATAIARRWAVNRRCWALLGLLALVVVGASAAPASTLHAFLNRNNVSLGDTVTLNIRAHGAIGKPELAPLRKDFRVLGTSRSHSVETVGGKTVRFSQLGIALQPRHAGTLPIPALDVGGAQTEPLTVQVGAAPAGGTGRVGDPVFLQAGVSTSAAYIDEQMVYTVRLFYQPGVHGSLGAPHADGARLIQLDRDHRYRVQRLGYTYDVIERSWALIPGRRGSITVKGPVFHGRRIAPGGGNRFLYHHGLPLHHPNTILNRPFLGIDKLARAVAPTVTIKVRAAPASAGKPWLPARGVQLKLTGLPANGAVDGGAPLVLTLSIGAKGQPAGALPQPQLPTIAGARVYPDQIQNSTNNHGRWLRGKRTRRFAIMPQRNGKLTIPSITLNWWNVVAGHAEHAVLPAHTLDVRGIAANAGQAAVPPASAVSVTGSGNAASAASSTVGSVAASAPGSSLWWRDVALASIVLWVIALTGALAWWGLHRPAREGDGVADSGSNFRGPGGNAGSRGRAGKSKNASARAVPKADLRALRKRALDAARADAAETCEHALLAWARAARADIAHVGALRDQLADPAQRRAVEALQRARWKGGDARAACAAVAQAFAHGFKWQDGGGSAARTRPALPPLYPS
jgi:hypothetical protein